MHQYCQRGHRAEAQVGHEGRGNENSIAKSVNAVAGQHRPAARLVVVTVVVVVMLVVRALPLAGVAQLRRDGSFCVAMLVAVVPQLGLVEQEKKHQADQQGGEKFFRSNLAFKGLR